MEGTIDGLGLSAAQSEVVTAQAAAAPHRVVFTSLSGAHLYGFPSVDSDFDLRGAHVLPADAMLRLTPPSDTFEFMEVVNGIEVDTVSFDVLKFFALMLKKNGNVLEQLFSPLVLVTSETHDELRHIAPRVFTRHHYHHYRGMTGNRRKAANESLVAKPLLYAFRAAMTGIVLLRDGVVDANINTLNERFELSLIDELVERKTTAEKVALTREEMDQSLRELSALETELDAAFESSELPEEGTGREDLDNLLVRLRLGDELG